MMTAKAGGRVDRFNTWMYQESDLVQGSAQAYTERLIAQAFIEQIEKADSSLQPILEQLFRYRLPYHQLGNFVLTLFR